MVDVALTDAIAQVPPGAWAVGVSGGADSVALLHLLARSRSDLQLIVAHLNHQTRGQESDADEGFVKKISRQLNIRCRTTKRSEIEAHLLDQQLPANPSARYRRLRFEQFRRAIESEDLDGVILAHHADDQAETVLQRLIRGSGYSTLAGMRPRSVVRNVTVLRPLLSVRRGMLREFLAENQIEWREDSSNVSPKYLRNRLRNILRDRPELTDALLKLCGTCSRLDEWVEQWAPRLAQQFESCVLENAPAILARRSATTWLIEQGATVEAIDRATVNRLIQMCCDAATASRQQFPGNLTVRRRAGKIERE